MIDKLLENLFWHNKTYYFKANYGIIFQDRNYRLLFQAERFEKNNQPMVSINCRKSWNYNYESIRNANKWIESHIAAEEMEIIINTLVECLKKDGYGVELIGRSI